MHRHTCPPIRTPLQDDRPTGATDNDLGVTLIEVIIAIFIFSVALLALASTVTASLAATTTAQLRQQAYTAATRSIEVARTRPFDELALAADASAIMASGFDPASGTIDAPEGSDPEPIRRTDTTPGLEDPLVHQLDGVVTMRTYVTVPAGQPDPPEQVRVTAVAEFTRRSGIERTRQSTLITAGSRVTYGREQPSFAVDPTIRGLEVERGASVCAHHRVINGGESSDRYRIERPGPGQLPDGLDGLDGIDIVEVQPGDITVPLFDSGLWSSPVGPGAELALRVCYLIDADTQQDGLTITLRVISEQAEAAATAAAELAEQEGEDNAEDIAAMLLTQASQEVVHEIEILRAFVLYLSGVPVDDDLEEVPALNDLDPPPPLRFILAPPDGAELLNYSPALDDRPGLLLEAGAPPARWEHPLDATRTIGGAQLLVWVSSPGILDGDAGSTDGALPLELAVELSHLRLDGTRQLLASEQPVVVLDGTVWTLVTVPLPDIGAGHGDPGNGGVIIDEGERIELRIGCVSGASPAEQPATPDDPEAAPDDPEVPVEVPACILAFGAELTPSSLQLVLP